MLLAVIIGVLFFISLRSKAKYDKARNKLIKERPKPYAIVDLDDKTTGLLNEVRQNWTQRYSEINGPHSQALQAVQLSPSVENLVYLFLAGLRSILDKITAFCLAAEYP